LELSSVPRGLANFRMDPTSLRAAAHPGVRRAAREPPGRVRERPPLFLDRSRAFLASMMPPPAKSPRPLRMVRRSFIVSPPRRVCDVGLTFGTGRTTKGAHDRWGQQSAPRT